MYPVFGIRRVGPGCLAEIEGLIRPILADVSDRWAWLRVGLSVWKT